MQSNLLNIQLLTEAEVGETSNVELAPNLETSEVKKDDKVADPATPTTPKIELLTPEEAGVKLEKDEEGNEIAVKEEPKVTKEDLALDYKALAESRIKNGAWDEYENWNELKDSVEWTAELFEKLETEQFQNKVQKGIEEEKSQFGSQYAQLLEHAKNGGNFQELLPSIQQELDIESLDETDLDSAEELIRAECEAKGWSEKRTKSYITSLKDQGDDENFIETAKEAKASLKSIVLEERQELIKQKEEEARVTKAYWETFNKKVRETIFKDEELSPKEQKDIDKFVFEYKHVDPASGKKYSDFNLKFDEIKNDPAKYAKLIKLVKNFDEVVKKDTAKKEAVKEISFLLRGASQSTGKKTSEYPELQPDKKVKGYNPFKIKP